MALVLSAELAWDEAEPRAADLGAYWAQPSAVSRDQP